MRFKIITGRTEKVIEADNLDEAVEKANQHYPAWLDVVYCDITNAQLAHIEQEVLA